MPENLLSDWQTDTVLLVWPHRKMNAYRDNLANLQSFYTGFLRELGKRGDRVVCVVPSARQAERLARATELPDESFRVALVRDIWVRDFAPLAGVSCFVRARYDPEYADTAHSRAVQSGFTRFLGRSWSAAGARHPMRKLDLILEGGNVCHNGRGGLIVTEKVLLRNRLVGAADLTAMLRTAVHVDRLGVVPVEPDDPIGHADGMVRWVDPHRLVVNDYANQPDPRYKRFSRKLSASLEEAFGNRKIITAPYPLPRLNLATPLDATGNYLNFLMTGNKLYLPAYGIPEDEEARAVLSNSCGAQISSVEATSLAREGGVLNCITWCFKSSAIDHMGSVRPSR